MLTNLKSKRNSFQLSILSFLLSVNLTVGDSGEQAIKMSYLCVSRPRSVQPQKGHLTLLRLSVLAKAALYIHSLVVLGVKWYNTHRMPDTLAWAVGFTHRDLLPKISTHC